MRLKSYNDAMLEACESCGKVVVRLYGIEKHGKIVRWVCEFDWFLSKKLSEAQYKQVRAEDLIEDLWKHTR